LNIAEQLVTLHLRPGEPPGRHGRHDARYLRWRELRRIRGVTPRAALETITAVYYLIHEQPALLPNDGPCLSRAMAHAVLHMRPLTGQWQPPGALVVSTLGDELRQSLVPFLVQVVKALDKERDERNRQLVTAALTQQLQ
jgi:hypothetical protein